VDEGHLDHPDKISGRFLKTGEYPAAFFQPANQPLNNIPLSVLFPIKLHRPRITVLVFLGRYHRANLQVQQILVNRNSLALGSKFGHSTALAGPFDGSLS